MPQKIPNYTDWIVLEKTNITELCGTYSYLSQPSNISYLSLASGGLTNICNGTINQILIKSNIKWLNLTDNRISKIPKALAFSENHLDKLWLSGNLVECNCDMTWLIDWLSGEGKHKVQDYQDIICMKGRQIGQPVYLVKPLDMGCSKRNATLFIMIFILGGVVSFVIITMGLIQRRADFRWLIYRKFGKLVGDPDKDENIDAMIFDAFISFRSVHLTPIMNNWFSRWMFDFII